MSNEYMSWILRYIPNTARGEFVNIGVLVGSDGSDWAIRHVSNFTRASRLGGDATFMRPLMQRLSDRVSEVNNSGPVESIYSFVADNSETISYWTVEELRVRFNNSLQISEPTPAYGTSAAEVANILYGHLVSETIRESVPRSRTRMKSNFRTAVMNAWHHDAVIPLEVGPVIEIGHLHQDFDFALLDGEVEQMTQVISINRKDRTLIRKDISAWNYAVTRLRQTGAILRSKELAVPRDTPIIMIHDEPKNTEQKEILQFAREGWSELGIESFSNKEIASAASRALTMVG